VMLLIHSNKFKSFILVHVFVCLFISRCANLKMKYTSTKGERRLTDNNLRRSKKKKLIKPSKLKRIQSKLLFYIFDDPELRIFKDIRGIVKSGEKLNDKENINRQLITSTKNLKRKIKAINETSEEEADDDGEIEKRNKLDKAKKMYDYRPTAASIKNENDFISKNEEDEENMINAFYQQRYLGGSNNSIATLCNIGNSCYLNSVIYTLRFAPKFLHKLHHLCDDLHYVYQKIGQNKLKSSSLGRNVSGLQVNYFHTN
jgi:hypothetical protein